jgi:hypothetical protein
LKEETEESNITVKAKRETKMFAAETEKLHEGLMNVSSTTSYRQLSKPASNRQLHGNGSIAAALQTCRQPAAPRQRQLGGRNKQRQKNGRQSREPLTLRRTDEVDEE